MTDPTTQHAQDAARPRFYLTTAIAYPNNKPGLHTLYEVVGADVIARWHRMHGYDTRFLTGTDEHSVNIHERAKELGKDTRAFVDEMVGLFRTAEDALGIAPDRFIRTTDPDHRRASQEMVRRAYANGDVYQGTYEGWYCPNEGFRNTSDLVEDAEGMHCPNHPGVQLQWLTERNWFFRLSAYADRLLAHYEANPDWVQPEYRKNEMLGFIRQGLEDISISRETFHWGIPFPIRADGTEATLPDGTPDPAAGVIYVWFDALINYITGAGFPDDPASFAYWWPADLHVIGKDINRFHTIIWPAMLMSAGLPLPRKVWVHGWLLAQGERMSKSRGNFLDPLDVVAALGRDGARYATLREVAFDKDTDVSWDSFVRRYNADLANDLGNLLNRTVSMTRRYLDGDRPMPAAGGDLGAAWPEHLAAFDAGVRSCLLHEALAAVALRGRRQPIRGRAAAVGVGQVGQGRGRGCRVTPPRCAGRAARGMPGHRARGGAVHAGGRGADAGPAGAPVPLRPGRQRRAGRGHAERMGCRGVRGDGDGAGAPVPEAGGGRAGWGLGSVEPLEPDDVALAQGERGVVTRTDGLAHGEVAMGHLAHVAEPEHVPELVRRDRPQDDLVTGAGARSQGPCLSTVEEHVRLDGATPSVRGVGVPGAGEGRDELRQRPEPHHVRAIGPAAQAVAPDGGLPGGPPQIDGAGADPVRAPAVVAGRGDGPDRRAQLPLGGGPAHPRRRGRGTEPPSPRLGPPEADLAVLPVAARILGGRDPMSHGGGRRADDAADAVAPRLDDHAECLAIHRDRRQGDAVAWVGRRDAQAVSQGRVMGRLGGDRGREGGEERDSQDAGKASRRRLGRRHVRMLQHPHDSCSMIRAPTAMARCVRSPHTIDGCA
ncbi:MAG: methionine--tRNA ligase [Chloroflexota bacterium]